MRVLAAHSQQVNKDVSVAEEAVATARSADDPLITAGLHHGTSGERTRAGGAGAAPPMKLARS